MKKLLLALAVMVLPPASAVADDGPVFADLALSSGWTSGSSSTTDGGAAFAGGGVVDNVKFGQAVGIGGRLGYRFDPALSAFVSYRHVRGDVSWDANFPMIAAASAFSGEAISHVVMANVARDWVLSDTTSVRASAGLGVSINALSRIVETDAGSGVFLSDVARRSHTGPAAEIGVGVDRRIAANAKLGLNASVSYGGRFKTGDTRTGNLGVTSITPYEIDDVWRADLGASIRFEF